MHGLVDGRTKTANRSAREQMHGLHLRACASRQQALLLQAERDSAGWSRGEPTAA